MALKIAEIKKQMENSCPLMAGREKGDWNDLENKTVHVTGAMMYTDSNGDTYGVITVDEIPDTFFLCGAVATKVVETVCNPENGGEFDDNGVMVEPFTIFVGGKVQSKDKGKSPYRSVKIVG